MSEVCVRPTPVAMVTKIWKFYTKITITQLALQIGPRILHQTGGFGGWPINRSHSNFC